MERQLTINHTQKITENSHSVCTERLPRAGLRGALLDLPFVADGESGRDMWAVQSAGTTDADYLLGEKYAELTVRLVREFDAPHILYWIARAWRTDPASAPGIRAGYL